MTENSKTLMGAILAVQKEAPQLQKNAINPAFKSKYLTLDALMEQVLPLLTKHGLVWVTMPGHDNGAPVLHYHLFLAENVGPSDWGMSGIKGTMPLMLDKQNSQGLGSAITYARRQSIMAVLGFTAGEDDDGNKASERPRKPPAPEIIPTAIMADDRTMTDEELDILLTAVNETPKASLPLLLASEGVDSPNLLTVAQGRRIFKKLGIK